MLIEQIIDFNIEGPKENLRVDCYLLLKCSQRQITLLPPIWTKSFTIKI